MILTFSKATGGQTAKGPFSAVRFEGEAIREREGAAPIASHLAYGWSVDGEDYLRLDVGGPVRVSWAGFAGAPSTTGHFSCVNGVAYIDRRILAFVDRERGDWYLVREGVHRDALLVQPAA